MNKKILAILMALLMVLVNVGAFAEGEGTPTYYVTKTLTNTADSSTSASHPEATFSFAKTGSSVDYAAAGVTAPDAVSLSDVTFAAGDTTSKKVAVNVDFAQFNAVGVYAYTFKETVPETIKAGLTYDSEGEVTVYVFVTQDPEGDGFIKTVGVNAENAKSSDGTSDKGFDNTYSAGDLKVSKTVTGTYGDRTIYFDVQVEFKGEANKTYEAIAVSGGSNSANPATVTVGAEPVTFKVKHGETLTFSNIPFGVTYDVTETDYSADNYQTTIDFSDKAGKKIDSAEDTVDITNTNNADSEIPTGVFTDNMPYFMLLAFVMILAAAVVLKKRTVNE